MQGIVLGVQMLIFLFSYLRKEKQGFYSGKSRDFLMIIGVTLASVCGCILFYNSSFMYVNDRVLLQEMKVEIEEKNDNVKNYYLDAIDVQESNSLSDMLDISEGYIKEHLEIVLGVLVIGVAWLLYHNTLMKKYCRNMKESLYELQHIWMKNKSLKNILIPVAVRAESGTKSYDICEFFKEKFKTEDPDMYFILGNPGAGKSVSIRKICDMLLGEQRERKGKRFNFIHRLGKRKQLVPVAVSFVEIKDIRSCGEFQNHICKHIYGVARTRGLLFRISKIMEKINSIILKKIKQGRFVLLIDGYDEINAQERFNVIQIIERFREEFPNCFLILSSRTAIYELSTNIQLNKDNILYLLPFTNERKFDFLSKWEFAEGKRYLDLFEKIINNSQLEKLAENPLLLTLIAYLYDVSTIKEPNSITEFYGESMKCLLEQWESQKRISKRIDIEMRTKCSFLEKLAYFVLRNAGINSFTDRQIIEETKEISQCEKTQQQILDEIYLYSGILEKDERIQLQFNKSYIKEVGYKFFHRSFWEFFAASYFIDHGVEKDKYIKDVQYHRVAFFYLALLNDEQVLEEYLEYNKNNIPLIETLLLECEVKNLEYIWNYLIIKVKQEDNRNENYYQTLGVIANKYKPTKQYIYSFLSKELEQAIVCKDNEKILFVLKGISCFCNEIEISELLIKYAGVIRWKQIAIESSAHINQSILYLMQSSIADKYKIELLDGMRESGKFSLIYSVFQNVSVGDLKEYIFYEFLQLTKNKTFIEWFDREEIVFDIEETEVRDRVNEWKEKYRWKWRELTDSQITKRYLLVYYLLNCSDDYELDLGQISNRIKFVAAYIKNRNTEEKLDASYIDIPEYKVEALVEFKYHWEKPKTIEKVMYNPITIRNIQWILCCTAMFVLMILIIMYKNKLTAATFSYLQDAYKEIRELGYFLLNQDYSTEYIYSNLQISKYIKANSHMLIFYFSWVFMQIQIFKQYVEKTYNSMYVALYGVITMICLGGYFIVFQDIIFRITGMILGLVFFTAAVVQHRYNLPSFRSAQFLAIRKYLETDKM